MRAKELASERKSESGFSKAFNWFYYLASNYGLTPGRPLLWIFLLYSMTFGFILCCDGGATRQELKSLAGWESSLAEDNQWARLKRSMILPIQSMNLVGTFRSNQVLVPNTGRGKIILSVFGLVSDGLFLFFIFGLRKRFKLP